MGDGRPQNRVLARGYATLFASRRIFRRAFGPFRLTQARPHFTSTFTRKMADPKYSFMVNWLIPPKIVNPLSTC
jgi:hypothetical protein